MAGEPADVLTGRKYGKADVLLHEIAHAYFHQYQYYINQIKLTEQQKWGKNEAYYYSLNEMMIKDLYDKKIDNLLSFTLHVTRPVVYRWNQIPKEFAKKYPEAVKRFQHSWNDENIAQFSVWVHQTLTKPYQYTSGSTVGAYDFVINRLSKKDQRELRIKWASYLQSIFRYKDPSKIPSRKQYEKKYIEF